MHAWVHWGGIPRPVQPSHFFKSMTMHQARTFSFTDSSSAGLSAAFTLFKKGMNGDDKAANNPAAPADLVINCRLVKFLPTCLILISLLRLLTKINCD
jgi:hypothetical protein